MARDFDFKRHPNNPPLPTSKPVVSHSPKPNTRPRSAQVRQPLHPVLLGVLIFAGLMVVGIGLIVQTNASSRRSSVEPLKVDEQLTQVAGATTEDGAYAIALNENMIQIYNSGSGDVAVRETVQSLAEREISAKILGKSQFEYDKTYVWYTEGKEELAKRIISYLGNRQTVLKQSTVNGSFDVLIYLGKN